jgi:hypothetical protein
MKRVALVSLLCWCFAANLAEAQQSATISASGPGLESCGTWNVNRQANQALPEEEFILGYAVGAESEIRDFIKKSITITTDGNGIFGWIDIYCQAHPTDNLTIAAAYFVLDSGTVQLAH